MHKLLMMANSRSIENLSPYDLYQYILKGKTGLGWRRISAVSNGTDSRWNNVLRKSEDLCDLVGVKACHGTGIETKRFRAVHSICKSEINLLL